MSERWFRLYEDLVNDPKVQRLPAETFKALINLWCIASRNGGVLPAVSDTAFALRISDESATDLIEKLIAVGLLDKDERGVQPHNWEGRQYKSDLKDPTAAMRNRRYRKSHISDTVCDTAPIRRDTVSLTATEADTEADTEAEQKQRAREAVHPPDEKGNGVQLDRLESELREAAGLTNSPSTGLFDLSPIVGLLGRGFSLEVDILPKLRAAAATGKTPATWRYYVSMIEEGKVKNSGPAKAQGPPEKPMVWVSSEDPTWSEVYTRHVKERSRPLIASGSKHGEGMGAFVPAEWVESRAAA